MKNTASKELKKIEEDTYNFLVNYSLDCTSVAIFWIDPEGTFLHVNKTACDRLGYSREELTSLAVSHVDPLYPGKVREDHWQRLREEKILIFESKHICKDGRVIPVEVTDHYFHLNGREFEVAFAADISGRKNVEKALEKSQMYFQSLFENAVNPIFVYDRMQDLIITFNSCACRTFGYTAAQFGACSLFDLVSEREAEKVRTAAACAKEKGEHVFESRVKTKNGTELSMLINIRVVEFVGRENFLFILQDISSIREAEKDLKRKEVRYEKLLESLNEGVCALDGEGHITFANKKLADITGFTVEELCKKSVYEIMAQESIPRARIIFSADGGEGIQKNDFEFRKKSGSLLFMSVESSPIYDEQGEYTGAMCGLVDITEQRLAELELQKQTGRLEQKNLALKEILARIEEEKDEIRQNVSASVSNLIFPLVQKIRLEGATKERLDILENNLEEICSSFGKKVHGHKNRLSPREIEICNLIKQGLGSKEISRLLHISPATTERYRNNIRKKLGLVRKNVNLATYLQNL